MKSKEYFMTEALAEAVRAGAEGEVPVGAVMVKDGEIIARGRNHKESTNSALGHAELAVIEAASQALGSWRLTGCELYVTLEPCVMCAGAIVSARIDSIVYGAKDPKGGAVDSLYQVPTDPRLNHNCEITSGVLETECAKILKDFFKARRAK